MLDEQMARIEKDLNDGIVSVKSVRELLYAVRQSQSNLTRMADEVEKYKAISQGRPVAQRITLKVIAAKGTQVQVVSADDAIYDELDEEYGA